MNILFFIVLIILLFLPSVLLALSKNKKFKADKDSIFDYINSLSDFNCTLKETGINQSGVIDKAIAVDEVNKKLALVTKISNRYVNRFISFNEIISTDIIEDGISINNYSKSGAIVGGIIAGIPGAVIGGLGSNSGKIKKLGIRIIINCISEPEFIFYSLNGKSKIVKKGIAYNSSRDITNKWYNIITVAIKRGYTTV